MAKKKSKQKPLSISSDQEQAKIIYHAPIQFFMNNNGSLLTLKIVAEDNLFLNNYIIYCYVTEKTTFKRRERNIDGTLSDREVEATEMTSEKWDKAEFSSMTEKHIVWRAQSLLRVKILQLQSQEYSSKEFTLMATEEKEARMKDFKESVWLSGKRTEFTSYESIGLSEEILNQKAESIFNILKDL